MKKRISALIIAVLLLFCAAAAYADDMWSEEYYRATDSTGDLTEAQRDDLEASCLEFIKKWHLDLALLALPSDKYDNLAISELALEYYNDCGFGYGEGHDGFMVVIYPDTGEISVVPIGAAIGRVPDDYLRHIANSALTFQENYGVYGQMYAASKMLNDYLADHPESETAEKKDGAETVLPVITDPESSGAADPSEPLLDENGIPSASLRVGENGELPAWYPKDPRSFPEYHDDAAPRVVDNADILTSEEEAVMNERLIEIRKETDKDIVIFTDSSAYGMDHMIYAADFYDYNGYGCGDDYEGVCLFICMDPKDRGWWAACSGPKTMDLYTEEIANQIDDMLFDFMVAGRYYEGISDWIENFRRLYLTGSPYTPDWALLMQDSSFERTHNESAPRIVDDAMLLNDSEIVSLESKASEISKKYNMDIVVHTARNEGSFSRDQYCEKYYYYNGFGSGENYDGILLTVFKRPEHDPAALLYASGSGMSRLTEVNSDRLISRCEDLLDDQNYYAAIDQWLDQTDHMLRTGRAPKSPSDWTFTLVLEIIIGLVVGIFSLNRARSRMATPAIKEDADSYYVPRSLIVRNISDIHTGTTSSRRYDPVKRDDDSGSGSSSSGRSSYSSSYTGSSGRTHSGSGRRF